jgi:hypothetical protein
MLTAGAEVRSAIGEFTRILMPLALAGLRRGLGAQYSRASFQSDVVHCFICFVGQNLR